MTIVNLALLNQHFDYLYYSALRVAKCKALLSLENLKSTIFDPDQWVFILQKEIQQVKLLINDFEGKEYVQFASDKEFLQKIYTARMLFFESNDEIKMREAFILNDHLVLLEAELHYNMALVEGNLGYHELNGCDRNMTPFYDSLFDDPFNEETLRRASSEIDDLLRSYQINELIACMVPEPGLINLLFETNKRIASQVKNLRIPSNVIVEDIKSSYREIFKRAFSGLKQLIESLAKDSMAVFMIYQISDIKYLEEMAEIDGYVLHDYFKRLKHFFKDQLHNYQRAQNFHLPEVTGLSNKKETPDNKPFSFGYQPGPRPLRPIVVAMHLEFDFLGESITVDDFMEVLMCKDLSKNTKIIQLAAKYNLIEGFRKRLKPWCSNLKPSSIERSGIFTSLNEGPLKAARLYKSTPLLPEVSDRMDAIFKAKYR